MSHLRHADSTHRAGTEKHLFLPEMPEKMKFFMNSEEFARRLCSWQREKGRQNLPWFTSDPYRRWLSEIMLQQTRVEAVRRYFDGWMDALPDIRALAEMDLYGAILGKALYTGAVDLAEAIKEASNDN